MSSGLDLELRDFVSETESFSTPDTTELEDIRHGYNQMCQHFQSPHSENLTILEGAVEGPDCDIPIRVYRPKDLIGLLPTLLYFHGGGWILGGLDSHDSITADLAIQAGVQVIAVDYRLAPEHPYPAAVDDCWAVYQTITEVPKIFDVDINRLVIGGDSAGANLAAVVTLIARDIHLLGFNAPWINGQLLLYPALSSEPLPSRLHQVNAPLFNASEMDTYIDLYLGRTATAQDKADFKIFPAQAKDFTNLPPAYVSSAELDPLADDGPDFVDKLKAAGVTAKSVVEPGLMHGWLRARHKTLGQKKPLPA
ncbi:alpha/beta hydrolase [Kiloniella sp.]|uniref:alpha/beta hydrolase n=1 Tax=Kiloniella sp. TaxID=1938587 RepID=UPI003B02074E